VKVLVIGSGGREHALCWALAASPLVDGLFCAPGNGGIAEVATCLAVDMLDFDGIVAACRANAIDFVVVGPEAPLVAGLVDRLAAEGIRAFGPNAAAARLEGSKAFTKDICTRFGIPTAASGTFSEPGPAKDFVRAQGAPIVVKADGLAAGKGVIIAMTVDEALAAVDDILGGQFGAAGAQVVIEEFLEGEEISFFALCDGRTALPLASAQDHKRVHDGDQGPNTGGMGAYSPAPALTPDLQAEVMERIIRPTMAGMAEIGAPFTGILFAGLMLTRDGPKLLEYNTRFGDPECEVLMLRLKSDLLPALIAACDGQLADFTLRWRDEFAMCVVMAANGYPGIVEKGSVIGNLAAANAVEGVIVFHAGTRAEADGRITAQGGRVLGVSAIASSVAEARARAYRAVDAIDWPGGFCRRDIGWRALARA
jgi:phosphoribosylamine--glycine ligase